MDKDVLVVERRVAGVPPLPVAIERRARLAPHDAVIAAIGGTPQPDVALGDDAALSPERLRFEREQAYFNEIYLLAPVAYFLIAFGSAILQLNLAAAKLLDLPRSAAGALPATAHFRAFICARFLPDFERFVRHALNGPRPERVQLQMRRADLGPEFAVTLVASADCSGQALRVLLELASDDRAALERSEERLRRIVYSAEEGIWEIDADARTSFVNPKMARLLGYTIEDMLGRPLTQFMDDEGRALLERNIARRQQGRAERHEFKFVRHDGGSLWAALVTNPIFDGAGHYCGALALVTDITERKASNELMWRQANFDDLTGLPNRHLLRDRLGHALAKARRDGTLVALLFIDLDDFKQVNDRLGHDRGDRLLAEAAARIAACVRTSDTVGRLGGDEFTVILPGLEQVGCVERVAQHTIDSLVQPFVLDGELARVSASIGIALYPADADEVDALLRHADQAMYAAKAAGRNRYSYFTPVLQEAALQRQDAALDLRAALAAGQFTVYYQPIVRLADGCVQRAEALLRWSHPARGLLAPAEFLAVAESSGLIVEIGDWVFRQAASQLTRWQMVLGPTFQISVNLSPLQLRADSGVLPGWGEYLDQLGLPPRSVLVEFDEALLLDGGSHVAERLRAFHAMGLQVALDHFGTGAASLSQLMRFGIDLVKIDRSFVEQLEQGGRAVAVCEAIIAMAHKLGLAVVAGGVETLAQRDALLAAGCDAAQGYVFAPAMPAEQFVAMAGAALPALAH